VTAHEVTGTTAERVRQLCAMLIATNLTTENPMKRAAAVILAGLPPRERLGAHTPPFVELCWKMNGASIFDTCDRRAGHSGWHTWETPGQAPF
jgi:hypothetical protein